MTMEEENRALKRLLRLAVDDLRWMVANTTAEGDCIVRQGVDCNYCPLSAFDFNEYIVNCRWQYETEALKLIGGD